MRAEHRMILDALHVAVDVARSPVSSAVVLDVLDPDELERLEKSYSAAAEPTVERILRWHSERGRISSMVGEDGVLVFEDTPSKEVEEPESMRQRVLRIAMRCTDDLGRPALVGDLRNWLEERGREVASDDLNASLASLVRTGDLEIVKKVRGHGHYGHNLYAPPGEYSPEEVDQALPKTWLGLVLDAFRDCWADRVKRAAKEDRSPRPPGTGDVRERYRERGQRLDRLEDPQLLCNALKQLTRGNDPKLRAVRRRKERLLLWAPVEVSDAQLDLGDAYAADTDRVLEAVARAERHWGHPVTARQVEGEITVDPALRPAGTSAVASILSDLAKTKVDAGDGNRLERSEQKLHRVGSVGGRSVYTVGSKIHGLVYADLKQIESDWAECEAGDRRSQIGACPVEPIRYGRARLLAAELEALEARLLAVDLDPQDEGPMEQLRKHLLDAVRTELDLTTLELPLSGHDDLPTSPVAPGVGFVAEELMVLLRGLYPPAEIVSQPNKLTPLLSKFVRRVPNPRHTTRFDSDSKKAAEYLFERTDMLQKAAFRWGTHESQLQATISRNVLGRLRDVRYVIPALDSDEAEVRLTAVACLAFLQNPDALTPLRDAGQADPDPQVRSAADWARRFLEARDELDGLRDMLTGREPNA